jgi:hypothetical protein
VPGIEVVARVTRQIVYQGQHSKQGPTLACLWTGPHARSEFHTVVYRKGLEVLTKGILNFGEVWWRQTVYFLMRMLALFVVCLSGLQSCSATPTVPDFFTVGSLEEQRAISHYYRSEAAQFRQRSQEMAERASAYRELFGEESEWVSGARALGEYYEREAGERERLAEQYQSPGGLVPSSPSP